MPKFHLPILTKIFLFFISNNEQKEKYKTRLNLGDPIVYPVKFFRYLFLILDFFIPKKKNKIIFFSVPNFTDNPRTYYEYIKKEHPRKFKMFWLFHDPIFLKVLKKPIKKSYWLYSWKGLFHLITSKYIVWDHSTILPKWIWGNRHIILQLWHGMPIKTIGTTEKNISKNLEYIYRWFGKHAHFFVTSDIFKYLMQACFAASPHKIHITGQPRTDICFSQNKDVELFLNTKNYKKIILYLPTYKECKRCGSKDISSTLNNIFYMNDYDESTFSNFIKNEDVLFILKPHPFDELHYIDFMKNHNTQNVRMLLNLDLIDNGINLNQLFPYIDILITDFSSASIDFSITRKPIIFLNNLQSEYTQNRGFLLESNYEKIMTGQKVRTFNQLIETLKELLNKNKEKNFCNDISLLHKYPDNKSCERIYNIMKNI